MNTKSIVIKMPNMLHIAQGKFWFFLPVPFAYEDWPFKEGDDLLVTVELVAPQENQLTDWELQKRKPQ